MRSSWVKAALLCTTMLTPSTAEAGVVAGFISGIGASIGASATTAAVATALGGAASVGFSVGTFLFTTFTGQLLLSFGLSAALEALAPRPSIPQPEQQLFNFAQNITPMQNAVGRVRSGGPYLVFADEVEKRHYAVALASHEIDGIEQHYLDDEQVSLDGSGNVTTAPFDDASDPIVNLRSYTGTSSQAADQTLIDAIPEWTSAHDLKGIAYVAGFARRVPAADFGTVYGNSAKIGPTIAPVFRGSNQVYDPRTDTNGYTTNAALNLAWMITRFGVSVDWDSVEAEADAADVQVTNRDGQSQARWTLNAKWNDDQDLQTLLQQASLATDAQFFRGPDGSVSFKLGRYIEPDITLTEDDFYSLEISQGQLGTDAQSEWVGRYIEPDYDWKETPTGIWTVDATPSARRRGEVPAYFSDSHNQTVRVVKRAAREARAEYRVRGQIGLMGYELLGGTQGGSRGVRFVRINAHGFNFVAEVSRISRGDNMHLLTLECASVTEDDFAFNAATEEPERPPRATPTSSTNVPEPTGLVGTAIDGPGIEWSYDPQPSAYTQEIRARQVGTTNWITSPELTEAPFWRDTGLADGATYEAEIRNLSSSGRASDWAPALATVVAVANGTAPSAVSNLASAVVSNDASITWTAPNDANYSRADVYRANYSAGYSGPYDIGDATMIGSVFGAPNSSGGYEDTGLATGHYAWWVTSVNSSGISGPDAGPTTEDI